MKEDGTAGMDDFPREERGLSTGLVRPEGRIESFLSEFVLLSFVGKVLAATTPPRTKLSRSLLVSIIFAT